MCSRCDGVSADDGSSVLRRLPKMPSLADLEAASVCVKSPSMETVQ